MLELLLTKSRACPACGAGAWQTRGGVVVYDAERDGTFLEGSYGGGLSRAPRERSGLAHAAGFAGVLYLFRYSLAPLVFAQTWQEWTPTSAVMFAWNLLAPAALALSFAAAVSLERSPWKSGRLPALFGFFAGWFGVFSLLDDRWLAYLRAF